jgi:hypothetical protein
VEQGNLAIGELHGHETGHQRIAGGISGETACLRGHFPEEKKGIGKIRPECALLAMTGEMVNRA